MPFNFNEIFILKLFIILIARFHLFFKHIHLTEFSEILGKFYMFLHVYQE